MKSDPGWGRGQEAHLNLLEIPICCVVQNHYTGLSWLSSVHRPTPPTVFSIDTKVKVPTATTASADYCLTMPYCHLLVLGPFLYAGVSWRLALGGLCPIGGWTCLQYYSLWALELCTLPRSLSY